MMKIFRKMPRWAVLIGFIVGIGALWFGLFRLSDRLFFEHYTAPDYAEACVDELLVLEHMKSRFARSSGKPDGSIVTWEDIGPYEWQSPRGMGPWSCPKTGQKYILGPVGSHPTCPSGLKGHELIKE